jgi:hypothetical protein
MRFPFIREMTALTSAYASAVKKCNASRIPTLGLRIKAFLLEIRK